MHLQYILSWIKNNILDFRLLLSYSDNIYCDFLFTKIPKLSRALRHLKNFITIVYWPQPLKIYNHAYQFKWRRLDAKWRGMLRAEAEVNKMPMVLYYIGKVYIWTPCIIKIHIRIAHGLGRTHRLPHSYCLYFPHILTTTYFIYPFSIFACINDEKTKNKNMAIYNIL